MTDGDSVTIDNLRDSANVTFVTLDDYLPLTEEVRRFKEEQKQIMIEKERQARERHEQEAVHSMGDSLAAMVQQQSVIETMMNDEQDRPAILAQSIDERYYKKVENFTGEQAWRDWSFQFKATTRIVNEAAYHLVETAENEEKEINDALSLSEEQRSLSSEIFNILGSLITGELLQILYTSGSSGFEALGKLSKRYNERDVKKQQETNMTGIKIRSIWEISWQRLRNNLSRGSQLLSMGTDR